MGPRGSGRASHPFSCSSDPAVPRARGVMKGLFILLITGPHSPKGDGDGASGAMARMYNRTGQVSDYPVWTLVWSDGAPFTCSRQSRDWFTTPVVVPDCPEGGQWRSSTRGAGQSSQNFDPSNLARSRHWRPSSAVGKAGPSAVAANSMEL